MKKYWYKAVHKVTEQSCCWSLRTGSEAARKLGRVYHNGDIVEADSRTLGCFLFKRMDDAFDFIETSDKWKLKRVIPLAPCKKIQADEIFGSSIFEEYTLAYIFELSNLFLKSGEIANYEAAQDTPNGTYTCMKLKVVDDVVRKDRDK
jgi:hypothetical protein